MTWRLLPELVLPVVAVAAAGAVVSVGAATGAVVSVGAATGAVVVVGTGTGVAVGVSTPQAARNGTTTISSATMSANRLYALYITLLLKRHLPESIVLSDNYVVPLLTVLFARVAVWPHLLLNLLPAGVDCLP